jgi:cysteinyl-tRNA synthetase
MARRYLGDTLDLHAGGVDLIFPHHEDEIAQSEGANGVPFARMWCHGEFLLTEGAKMAKRVGNVATVEGLRAAGVSAAAVRHFMFSVHYRKQLNLAEESLEASSNAVRRVGDFAERLAAATGGTANMSAIAEQLERTAIDAFNDDLNAPEAMAALFEFIRMINAELDAGGSDAAGLAAARKAFAMVNGVLDIVPGEPEVDAGLAEWVEGRLAARREARARRDFAAADAIRGELDGKGIAIEDTPQGTRWKKVR